jgi:hypothetical protein
MTDEKKASGDGLEIIPLNARHFPILEVEMAHTKTAKREVACPKDIK